MLEFDSLLSVEVLLEVLVLVVLESETGDVGALLFSLEIGGRVKEA